MKKFIKTKNGKKGGLFVGKTHEEGGIPAIVVDTGQPVEIESGEAIINAESTKKYWKQLSKINQSEGNGVPIPPPTDYENIRREFNNGGLTPNMTKSEIKKFYDSPQGKKLDAETYSEWKRLVNMSSSELESFYNSQEGKDAGLSKSKANSLGIDNGRTSAQWILKMKSMPYTSWSSPMWIWAKKQISFIKRMSGNKGSLYDDNNNKTRKHTSLLIWGHNPVKKKLGGLNRGGDCYFVAGKIAMNNSLPNNKKFTGVPYLVQAEVTGQGALSGIKYGHSWIEDDNFVYDFSNNREIVIDKQYYYLVGKVKQTPPKYFKYTFKEAVNKMIKTGHYGSWELKTESGP